MPIHVVGTSIVNRHALVLFIGMQLLLTKYKKVLLVGRNIVWCDHPFCVYVCKNEEGHNRQIRADSVQ